jgi:hypothetical protein
MMVIFAKEERAGAVEKVRALRGRGRGARRRRNEDIVNFRRLKLLGGGLSKGGLVWIEFWMWRGVSVMLSTGAQAGRPRS